MTKLSDRFLSLAERMVSKFGVTSQWLLIKKTTTDVEGDPTSCIAEETSTLVDLAIIAWKERDYDGKTIKIGDKPAIMPASVGYPVPMIGDVLESVVDGTRFRIIASSKIYSVNGITVAYKLNLRG